MKILTVLAGTAGLLGATIASAQAYHATTHTVVRHTTVVRRTVRAPVRRTVVVHRTHCSDRWVNHHRIRHCW